MPINQCRKTFLKAYLLERRGKIDLSLQAVVTPGSVAKDRIRVLRLREKKKGFKYQISNIKTRLQKVNQINQNPTPKNQSNQSKPDSEKNSIKSIKKSDTCSLLSRAHATFFLSWKKKNLAIAIAIHVSGARFRRRRNPRYLYLNTLESKQSGYGIRTPGIEIGRSTSVGRNTCRNGYIPRYLIHLLVQPTSRRIWCREHTSNNNKWGLEKQKTPYLML